MDAIEVKPLKTLDELLCWEASSVADALRSKVRLKHFEHRFADGALPLLVCHDMKGGYLQDRFAGGCRIGTDTDWPPPPFYLAHWNYFHVFVYFSHNFVTIPPVGWIDVAHRNGVKVLGTIITEWDDGAKLCAELLSEPAKWRSAAEKLAEIAQTYGFDGWLINLENVIEYEQIETLREFLGVLHSECHRKLPCGDKQFTLVWYDSVIASSGRLKWQDELNPLNAPFFEKCDGIFLNYSWTESSLKATEKFAMDHDIPKNKILVGIDAFGRGCMGGGGFQCNIPYDVISKFGFGAALFAPGWAYETLSIDNFVSNLHKFWIDMLKNCTRRQHRVVRGDDLPLSTTFSGGVKLDHDVLYYDYAGMDLMPHLLCQSGAETGGLGLPPSDIVMHWKHGLMLEPGKSDTDSQSNMTRHFRIFCCNLPDFPVEVSMHAKSIHEETNSENVHKDQIEYKLQIVTIDAVSGECQLKETDFTMCSKEETVCQLRSNKGTKLLSVNVVVKWDSACCGRAFLCLTKCSIVRPQLTS